MGHDVASASWFLNVGLALSASFMISFGSFVAFLLPDVSQLLQVCLVVSGIISILSFLFRIFFCSSTVNTDSFYTRDHLLAGFGGFSIILLSAMHIGATALLAFAVSSEDAGSARAFATVCSVWHGVGALALALSALLHFTTAPAVNRSSKIAASIEIPLIGIDERRFRFDRIV